MLACTIISATLVPTTAAGHTGQLMVVQAVPGLSVDVTIDGRTVREAVGVADVLGPSACRRSPM